MTGPVTGQVDAATARDPVKNIAIFTYKHSVEPRHENKSYLTCPKDQH